MLVECVRSFSYGEVEMRGCFEGCCGAGFVLLKRDDYWSGKLIFHDYYERDWENA